MTEIIPPYQFKTSLIHRIFLLCSCFFFICFLPLSSLFAQSDTLRPHQKFKVTGLPIVSVSPETGFKFGLFSYSYFDAFRHTIPSRPCRLKFGGSYTLRKQANLEVGWIFYTKNESYTSQGEIEYSNWIDRFYGIGNKANAALIEYDKEGKLIDTLNFLTYKVDFFNWNMQLNKKISSAWYAGLNFDFEHTNNYSINADNVRVLSLETSPFPIEGQRLGLGFNVVYDTRKYIGNPLQATYIQFTNAFYVRAFQSDFAYSSFKLDIRQYFNFYKKQSLALRLYSEHLFSKADKDIPLRALPKLGGKRLLRGYYSGTYLDKNLLAIETEYRIPLWQDDDASTWKIWKHFGIAVFMSAGKVYSALSAFNLNDFRLAGGAGIRISISPEQRSNIRVDYGIGFAPNSGGKNQKQRGIYITINEAF